MADMPKVFTIPAAYGFAEAMARTLLDEADAFALGQTDIYLPTRRAVRTLQQAFLREAKGRSILLPNLMTLGDLEGDELGLSAGEDVRDQALNLPPAMPPAQRLFLLARLVDQGWPSLFGHAEPKSTHRVLKYAQALMSLLETLETEGLGLEALGKAAPADPELADFWEQAARFINLVQTAWPAIEGETGKISAAARRRASLELQAQHLGDTQPEHRIILAGTTATIPAVADLAAVIARLPNGQVVLPGLDQGLEADVWDLIAAAPTHPQHGMAALLTRLGVAPSDVLPWPGCTGAKQLSRHDTLAAAQRPAGAERLVMNTPWNLDGLTLAEADSPEHEARTIALFLREALEDPGAEAALVTPDRDLASRVAAELARWDLQIDDSAGLPLGATAQGRLVRQTADLLGLSVSTLGLSSLFQHPFVRLRAADTDEHSNSHFAAALDLGLRGMGSMLDAAQILWPARAEAGALEDFFAGGLSGVHPLAVWLERHLAFLEVLNPEGADLWEGEEGHALADLFEDLRAQGGLLPPLSNVDYGQLIEQFLAGSSVRPNHSAHPRLAILGTLEARLLKADAVALGGLNEGTWPKETDVGPWMNRPTRALIGLPSPERKVGLAAHDLAQALGSDRVLLTRATRAEGAPTLASRWVERLKALVKQSGQEAELTADAKPYLRLASRLDMLAEGTRPDSVPTLACPPVAVRPTSFWATHIEVLVTNPYAFYAKQILGLRSLTPRGAEPATLAWGNMVHEILERYIVGEDRSEEALEALATETLGQQILGEDQRALWQVQLRHTISEFWRLNAPYAAEKSSAEISGSIQLSGIKLGGKADRLISRGKTLQILDYKTGSVPAKAKQESGESPQIPILRLIGQGGGFGDFDAAESGFFLLPRRLQDVGREEISQASLDTVREGLETLLTAYQNPDQPYISAPFGDDVGRAKLDYDDYAHLARRVVT